MRPAPLSSSQLPAEAGVQVCVLGFEKLSQAWARDTSGEHIGALELEALYVALVR